MSGSRPPAGRAFVLGFDGVPWGLIDRWTDAGELPNFARLREEGASGPLESTRPATTPLAWPSIATGVRPDKHGIYGFQKLTADHSHRMYTSADCRQPPIWEQLSPAVVGNVPMTYPPTAVDGELVAGMMTPSTESEYTHPPALAAEIDRRIPDYRISLNYPEYADRLGEFEDAIDDLLERRRALLELLMEREEWALFFFVFTAPDRLQHLIWDDRRLLAHYRRLDTILGEVIEYVDGHGADLYVVSDHGFGPIDTLVNVNHLLEREGYLHRRADDGTRGALASLGISREAVVRALDAVGVSEEFIVSKLPRTVVDSVAERIPGDHALFDVDFERTTAFVHDAGCLYINDTERFEGGVVSPERVPTVKAELVELLESISRPGVDGPVVRVFDGDELFPTDDGSPDLVVNGRGRHEVRATMTDELFSTRPTRTSRATVVKGSSSVVVRRSSPVPVSAGLG